MTREKTYVFVPRGGEGVALGAASAVELLRKGGEVVVIGVPRTKLGFRHFVQFDLEQLRAHKGTEAILVDLAQPLDSSVTKLLVEAIRTLRGRGITVKMIDHHHRAVTFPWKEMFQAGAEVYISASPSWSFYFPLGRSPLKASRHLAKYAGIIHRDAAVIPFIDERDELIAAGMVAAAAKDFDWAVQQAIVGNFDYFLGAQSGVREVDLTVRLHGKVAEVQDLPWNTGVKNLHLAIKRLGDVQYAVGVTHPRRGMCRVIAARNWRIAGLPPTSFVLGHGSQDIASAVNAGAVVFEVKRQEAKKLATKVIRALRRYDPQAVRSNEVVNPFDLAVKYMQSLNFPRSMTVHGPDHISRVLAYGNTLIGMFGVDSSVAPDLMIAFATHDLGLSNDGKSSPEETREQHHRRSAQILRKEFRAGNLTALVKSEEQLERIAQLVIAHRRREPLPTEPRLARAASILRFADALDVTTVRAIRNDWGEDYEALRASECWPQGQAGEEEISHWEGHRAVRNVRLVLSSSGMRVESLVNRSAWNTFAVERLQEDAADLTAILQAEDSEFRIDWSIVQVEKS